jgi:hypothetical protein
MACWVDLPTVLAIRFVWSSARDTFKNRVVAVTVSVSLHGAFCAFLGVLTLECLMSNLLAVVALGRSWATFKDAGRARFPSNMKVSVGQEPSCITAFGQVNNH